MHVILIDGTSSGEQMFECIYYVIESNDWNLDYFFIHKPMALTGRTYKSKVYKTYYKKLFLYSKKMYSKSGYIPKRIRNKRH